MTQQSEYRDTPSLASDMMRIGPASTPAREAVVTLIGLVLIGIVLVRYNMSPFSLAVSAVLAVAMVVRWAIGVRRWRA